MSIEDTINNFEKNVNIADKKLDTQNQVDEKRVVEKVKKVSSLFSSFEKNKLQSLKKKLSEEKYKELESEFNQLKNNFEKDLEDINEVLEEIDKLKFKSYEQIINIITDKFYGLLEISEKNKTQNTLWAMLVMYVGLEKDPNKQRFVKNWKDVVRWIEEYEDVKAKELKEKDIILIPEEIVLYRKLNRYKDVIDLEKLFLENKIIFRKDIKEEEKDEINYVLKEFFAYRGKERDNEGDKEIKLDKGDKSKETTTHPEPVSETQDTEINSAGQSQSENKSYPNSSEIHIGPQSKEKFNVDSIDIKDEPQDVLDIKTAKEIFKEQKILVIKEALAIYSDYLINYANNLEFVKIPLIGKEKLQKNLLYVGRHLYRDIKNIKTNKDLDNLYQKYNNFLENSIIKKILGSPNRGLQFLYVINACKNGLETDFKTNNQENISKQEIRKQINNIKGKIFETIRRIDETDDRDIVQSWYYEANFHSQTLNHLLTETNLIEPKQLSDIAKIDEFDYNKLLKDFLNKKEPKDNQTETEILQNNYYLLEIQNNLSQLDISEDFKQELLKESNDFFKEHFEKGYEKQLKSIAEKKYSKLFLQNIDITSKIWQNTLNKYGYTKDIITGEIKELGLNFMNNKEKNLKKAFEEIIEKLKQYKLPKFKNVYKQTIKDYQTITIQQYKLYLKEKLTNYYLNNVDKDKIIKQAKEDKLVNLYTKIHGLGEYKTSDKTEENIKFRSKEIAIQTLMMIPAIKIGDIPAKLALGGIKRTAKVKLADYVMSTFTFTQVYNIEDILRKQHVDDQDNFIDKYRKSLLDRKTLTKNMILLGGMKYLKDLEVISKVETITKTQILQKLGNNYNTTGEVTGKIAGFSVESISAISLMEGGTLLVDHKSIGKEDVVFAISMIIALKAVDTPVKIIENKVKKFLFSKNIEGVYIENKGENIKKENINKFKEKIKKTDIENLVEDFAKRYQNRPWNEIKNKKHIKDKINLFIDKGLGVDKYIKQDKQIKDDLVKILEERIKKEYQKYLEEGGNNNYGGEIVDAKLSRAIEAEKEYKLINQMISSIEKQGEDILSKKAIKGVEKFLNKYVGSEKFYEDYPKAKNLPRFDKAKQVKHILNEYIKIGKLVDDLRDSKLPKEAKFNIFIKGLEIIDEGMIKLVKNSLEERKKAPKK